ncbi:MAG: UDP-N-acetylglucosamine 2-epimerase (non-hydrolyzing) [Acidobacteria bacterium 21-70-11]|nr:MAG: UDP-N-acetylglucosamine 2-epimerase (non-hydrolyzing) [Acidobacteria bacterium 21-70-11]
MKHVMLIFGTRPEAIKMLPLIKELRARARSRISVVVTGQHKQMLRQVFDVFEEAPDIDLELMSDRQTLADVTARVLTSVAAVVGREAPDLVLVHGDTTTAMAAALAAFYAKVPVGHVEAGLRSHDIFHPWPEEYNRISVDAVSELLFAPTEISAENLKRESPRPRSIYVTGNTGIDALIYMAQRVGPNNLSGLALPSLDGKKMVLVTGHRRESFGEGFENICEGINQISARPDVEIVYPVHLNPMVKEVVNARLGGRPNVHLLSPVLYDQMVALMKTADVILTDSGGIQEEAPALGKPVVVMRDVTERPEAVATGVVTLVGTNPQKIASEVLSLLWDEVYYTARARKVFPYGDGNAAAKIADAIEQFFTKKPICEEPQLTTI